MTPTSPSRRGALALAVASALLAGCASVSEPAGEVASAPSSVPRVEPPSAAGGAARLSFDATRWPAEARVAYFRAVAAQQQLQFALQVQEAADAASELALGLRKAGNFSALAQMREQSLQFDARALRLRAQHQVVVERERLVRALDLGASQLDFSLPDRLPDLPEAPWQPQELEEKLRAQQLGPPLAGRSAQAQSEWREAYSAYLTSHELARHYRDEAVPLSRRISDEQLLRYNGMLSSVFELLADARAQIGSVAGAIDALRDFWVADTQLQEALAARTPGDTSLTRPGEAAQGAASPSH